MPDKTGCLYIVATPIGHPDDITLRALTVLKEADAVICEEHRVGTTLLKKLGVPVKEIILLNEHNEADQAAQIALRLAQGAKFALISDTGTPVFADPGHQLINIASGYGVAVVPIPGASSLMAALSVLDAKLEQFFYAGFLPRDPAERRSKLTHLRALRVPLVIMDTPYRLGALLDDITRVFGAGQPVTVACDLTLPSETIYRGASAAVRQRIGSRKAEFVLIIHAKP